MDTWTDRDGGAEELTERPGHAYRGVDHLAANRFLAPGGSGTSWRIGKATSAAASESIEVAEQRRGVRRARGPALRRRSPRRRRRRRRRCRRRTFCRCETLQGVRSFHGFSKIFQIRALFYLIYLAFLLLWFLLFNGGLSYCYYYYYIVVYRWWLMVYCWCSIPVEWYQESLLRGCYVMRVSMVSFSCDWISREVGEDLDGCERYLFVCYTYMYI